MELFDRRSAPKRADTWFVYALVDSRFPDEIRYVGITNNPGKRLRDHSRECGREGTHKANWIKSVLGDGGDVLIGILDCGLTLDDAKATEIALIAIHKGEGAKLTNLTNGGDGTVGYSMSTESRQKLSRERMGQPGRPHSEETRALISAAKLGIARPDSVRAKLSAAKIGKPGIKHSEATKAKISAANLGKVMPREAVERAAEKNRGRQHSATRKAEITDSLRSMSPKSNNSSGYKGVSFHKLANKWRARINLHGKEQGLGLFNTAAEAARAYDAAAIRIFGNSCYLNFPDELSTAA